MSIPWKISFRERHETSIDAIQPAGSRKFQRLHPRLKFYLGDRCTAGPRSANTHEPRNRERESSVGLSLSLSLCVRVFRACVEYGRFLWKIKVGRKSFIACLPHRNCCIKRPWTKNRCARRWWNRPVTSLPRGSARITDVVAAPVPKHFFRQVDGAAWEPFTVFPFEIALRALSLSLSLSPLARARVRQTNSIPVELHAISRINF